jgi:hypothetical protein
VNLVVHPIRGSRVRVRDRQPVHSRVHPVALLQIQCRRRVVTGLRYERARPSMDEDSSDEDRRGPWGDSTTAHRGRTGDAHRGVAGSDGPTGSWAGQGVAE